MRICGGGFLLKNRRILLGRRGPDRKLYPNMWDIFGGHCEAHETPEEALVRELEEELSVRPTEFREVAVLKEPQPALCGQAKYHLYVISKWTGTGPTNCGHEHSEIRWFDFKDLQRLDLALEGYRDVFRTLECQLKGEAV